MSIARLLAGFVLFSMTTLAQTPVGTAFTYQGRLDQSGVPLSGTADFQVTPFDALSGGNQVGPMWTVAGVGVVDGLFTLTLDFGAGPFGGNACWLNIAVRSPSGIGTYTQLTPRQPLTATPNALFALNADQLDGLDAAAFLQTIPVPLALSGASATHIVRATNSFAGGGSAVVYGVHSSPSGTTYGGRFESASSVGRAVAGTATSTSGSGVGGYFESAADIGTAVYARATSATGISSGLIAISGSPNGFGVKAYATADTGWGVGGAFEADGTAGIAVRGWANATTGNAYGVLGRSASTSGRGVYGIAQAGTGTIYGVYGSANTASDGFAVYASGDMGASGVKPFRIDHPMDPANKYLLHYAVEGPEVLNTYCGKALLDEAGEAVVELPAYFASVNKDPRYTLTAIGAPMPMLHIAEEISEEALRAGETARPGVAPPICSFRVAGGAPGAKVSWEIKAVRNDPRVRLHGAPVEREKMGTERGKYQHPEYFGQARELGMDFDPDRTRPVESMGLGP